MLIPCDTILVAAGLVPENELSTKAGVRINPLSGGPEIDQNMETSVPGIFAAGDVAYIHNLVDQVSQQGEKAGRKAAELIKSGGSQRRESIPIEVGEGIALVAPQRMRADTEDPVYLDFRVDRPRERSRVQVVDRRGALLTEQKFRCLQPSQIETVAVPPGQSEAMRILVL
jgi:sarcosine oxidase subunit alpha